MRKGALLGAATMVYVVAAWSVAPGFYDGFTPPQPYNWVCPPPQAGANSAPASGHLVVKVIGGVSDANDAITDDGQFSIGFYFGALDSTGKTTITVDIKPVSPCPSPPGLKFVTNTYLVTADAPLVKSANLDMVFSDLVPAPSAVYRAANADGPWQSIGASNQAAPYTINTSTNQLGYFAAGYPSNIAASGPRIGGGQLLPIVVAALIVLVILAGIPLAIVRRRRGGGTAADEEDES